MNPKIDYEKRLKKKGYSLIAGIDEAGRGPLAGPVVAAAVVLRDSDFVNKIDDSKRLSPTKRQVAYREILKKAIVGVGIVDEDIIDEVNILRATLIAMERAISDLISHLEEVSEKLLKTSSETSDKNMSFHKIYFLIDGNVSPRLFYPCKNIISGDKKCLSIACASIVAKVARDNIMSYYNQFYPQYGFARHKGYGTKEHLLAIQKFGPSPIHRMSFRPIKYYR
jgi:ribonuclease HII